MNTTDKAQVNSRPWWEDYFANQWDANNGRGQTKYFMRRLVENLPPAEREYLASREASILDWGCAFGDGVEVLTEAFPRCRVAGLDFAERAVAEARRCFPQHEFRHTPDGSIGDHFDAIAAVSCLEHFPDPLEVMREHLRCCRGFYAAMAPYRESPLPFSHLSQFREECFPERLDGFTRVAAKVVDCEFQDQRGKWILVVYASASYLRERDDRDLQIRERQKWDNYYATLPMLDIDGAMQDFGDDLAERIGELLPRGGKVLEAGCGAGWQSLALAQKGRFQLTLMDFSSEALGYAERTFAQHQLSAEFIDGDVFSCGEPEYDLVFNAGVLEHYTFDQQVAFLRGMASRSTKYVLALVPNRMCYWYWLWRMQRSARGGWPFGKEMPMTDMSAAFEAAGLRFLGHWFGGATWSEFFIKDMEGLDGRLRDEIMAVHRSSVVPEKQRAYLVAALGCKENVTSVPSCWESASGSGDFTLDQLTASLADSLAVTVAAEHRCKQLDNSVAEREKACESLREELGQSSAEIARLCKELADKELYPETAKELSALKKSRGYRLLERLWRIRLRLALPGGRRKSAVRLLWRAAQRIRTPWTTLKHLARRAPRPPRLRLPRRICNAAAKVRGERGPMRPATEEAEQLLLIPGLVSVVLPVYNQAPLLRQAVESALTQNYRRMELIVVNDGSTDGAEKVLAEYVGDTRVRVLTQPNQGLPKALSNGFEFARGEFWTWTSADNMMHPDQLQRLVEFLQTHAETAMVYADYTAIDAAGRPLSDPTFRPQNRRSPHDPDIHLPDAQSFGQNVDNFIGPCFLYRGQVGRLLGEYNPLQGIEDFDYWLRLNLVGRIAHLDSDRPLYHYRVHDNSLSGRAAELKIFDHAHELMDYHRARKEFFAKPWTIYADAATLNWLATIGAGSHRVVPWTSQEPAATKDEKRLLLLHAGSLSVVSSRPTAGATVAAWFPAGAGSTDQVGIETAESADLCFAEDDATAARLAICVPHVFRATPGPELLELAVQWANNRTFYEATQPDAQRVRALPRVFRPQKRAARVMLQVDNFLQGGLEQVVIDLARSLAAERFDVSLLVLGRHEHDVAWAREAEIPLLRLPEENRTDHYRRLLQERRIELVSAHYSLFGAPIAAELGVPFVQTIHNTYVFFSPEGVAAYQANDPFTCAYTCVSRAVTQYSVVALGLPASKMVVAPNGVDIARLDAAARGSRQTVRRELGLKEEEYVFLNVGAIQPVKLHVPLIHAFAEVKREFPEAKLVLVGRAVKDEFLDSARRAVACHGLEDSVLLTGHRDDAPRFFAAADAFVLPSLFEGWSLALAEAIAAGLPVAATRVGSAPELLPQVDGRLVQPPFGSIANLNFYNLDHYAATPDPRFVAELAGAMKELCRERPRPLMPEILRRSFDCREAYKTYGHLFLWLLQGGSPAAARAWSNGRETSSTITPSAEAAVA